MLYASGQRIMEINDSAIICIMIIWSKINLIMLG